MSEDTIKKIDEVEKWTPSDWDILVRQEVMDHLDMFLPYTKTFNVGVKYSHPVVATMENGTKINNNEKANGVQLILDFNFIEDIKLENKK